MQSIEHGKEGRNISFAKKVADNERYTIRDMELSDPDGSIAFTFSRTELKPGMATRGHSHENQREVYEFVSGVGMMQVGDDAYLVIPGDVIYVPAGKFHRVTNDSDYPLIFNAIFEGTAQRPMLTRPDADQRPAA